MAVYVERPDGTVDTYPHHVVGAGYEDYTHEVVGDELVVRRLVFRSHADESPSRTEDTAYYHRGEWTSVRKD
jgi:hypothetical protein